MPKSFGYPKRLKPAFYVIPFSPKSEETVASQLPKALESERPEDAVEEARQKNLHGILVHAITLV